MALLSLFFTPEAARVPVACVSADETR